MCGDKNLGEAKYGYVLLMLCSLQEAASRVIDMDSFDPDVVRRFTEFLYTGDYEEFPAPDTPKAGPAAATTKPEGDGEDQDKDSANEISSSES